MASSSSLAVVDSDTVLFDPSSFLPLIPIPPVVVYKMKASGKVKVKGKKLCIKGDEKKIKKSSSYILASHPIPGNGTFEVKSGVKFTSKTKDNGKKIMLKGSKFMALFSASNPAKMPAPAPVPSPVPKHPGSAMIPMTKNTSVYMG